MTPRYFADPYEHFNQREETAWHDVMQVCRKGHKITDCLKSSPEFGKPFCVKCGEPTISKCEQCGSDIQGYYHVPNVFGFDGPEPPTHCHKCGNQFPWGKSNQREKLSLAAQQAIQLFVRQIQQLNDFPNATLEDPSFLRWRNQGIGLCDRFIPSSTHGQQLKVLCYDDPLQRIKPDDEGAKQFAERERRKASECLAAIIEEIENFDLPSAVSQLTERKSSARTSPSIHQEFHGTVSINALQVAADDAVQSLTQTNGDLGASLKEIAAILRESDELRGRDLREALNAIRDISEEMKSNVHKKNWQRILDSGTKLLATGGAATDLAVRLAPYLPRVSELVDNARRLIG